MKYSEKSDWQSVDGLISHWHEEVSLNQVSHAQASSYYNGLHYAFGAPVVICSSVVGTAAFTQLHQEANDRLRLMAGILSVVSVVLASLQTFLGFGERAEKHRTLGVGYEEVRMEIEELQNLPVHDRGKVKDRLDKLRQKIDHLGHGSPSVPKFVNRRANAKKPRHKTTGRS